MKRHILVMKAQGETYLGFAQEGDDWTEIKFALASLIMDNQDYFAQFNQIITYPFEGADVTDALSNVAFTFGVMIANNVESKYDADSLQGVLSYATKGEVVLVDWSEYPSEPNKVVTTADGSQLTFRGDLPQHIGESEVITKDSVVHEQKITEGLGIFKSAHIESWDFLGDLKLILTTDLKMNEISRSLEGDNVQIYEGFSEKKGKFKLLYAENEHGVSHFGIRYDDESKNPGPGDCWSSNGQTVRKFMGHCTMDIRITTSDFDEMSASILIDVAGPIVERLGYRISLDSSMGEFVITKKGE